MEEFDAETGCAYYVREVDRGDAEATAEAAAAGRPLSDPLGGPGSGGGDGEGGVKFMSTWRRPAEGALARGPGGLGATMRAVGEGEGVDEDEDAGDSGAAYGETAAEPGRGFDSTGMSFGGEEGAFDDEGDGDLPGEDGGVGGDDGEEGLKKRASWRFWPGRKERPAGS